MRNERKYMKKICVLMVAACMGLQIMAQTVTSPNGKLSVVQRDNGLVVNYKSQEILDIPAIGYGTAAADSRLPIVAHSSLTFTRRVKESYTMLTGKRLQCSNEANEYLMDLENGTQLVLRLYNDGLAFRYELSGQKNATLPQEQTTYRIPEGTKRWMQNWTDSYEEFFPLTTTYKVPPRIPRYEKDSNGYACRWGYPALLEPVEGVFALISEANIERRQSASCLYNEGELYHVTPAENELKISGDWHSPWRTVIIGNLADIVESTLITDVSEPCRLSDISWIHPGVVSWIYWAYNHGSNDYNIICKYVDMAVTLNLPYVLIDAEWDEMKDGKTIEDAVGYANSKGIKPIIWYNSSIGWIDGAPTPKFRLNKPEDREKEFAWCEKIGVAGVKIDFFSGDNQKNMDYCLDLLESAARHHLLVNFHGAPIPRGWQRTWPNLLSTEGVYGAEWYNNVPTFTKTAAKHNATIPFTRNVVGPMDYTPCAFSDSQHPHITSNAHELALTVLYESGLQHLADKPESYLIQPEAVQQFFGQLPTVWDETRYVSGYPGENVVLARRHQNTWYVAGINGSDESRTLDLSSLSSHLSSFISHSSTLKNITIFADNAQKPWVITNTSELPSKMECQPRGGFVIQVKSPLELDSLKLQAAVRGEVQTNLPLFQTKYTADPSPLVVGDTLFLYTSHDASPEDIPDVNEKSSAGFFMYDWLLWSTTDMVNWTEHGAVASLKDFPWRSRENGAWAIQTVERNGKYYLYAPLHGHGIGVLVADSPYGPFKDPLGKPLVWDQSNWYDIDPSVYTDADGQAYLYWGNPHCFYARLNEDMISLKDNVVRLPHIENYQEGPWFYRRSEGEKDGSSSHYYLAFASTCCPEGLGYAMSNSPTGPWESKGYIMRPTMRDRGNHPGIADFKGHTYVFGQSYDLMHIETFVHHERRSVSATEMTYNADGTIQEVPYWLDQEPMKQLCWLNPYQRVEAETMAWGFGLKSSKMGIPNTGVVADMPESTGKRNMYIYDINDGELIKLRGVDFGTGAKQFSITAAATGTCTVTLRLDSQDGPIIGTAKISATGSVDRYRAFKAKVSQAIGVHDLYLCFSQVSGDVHLDWWQFK
jgi:hypothetical protein